MITFALVLSRLGKWFLGGRIASHSFIRTWESGLGAQGIKVVKNADSIIEAAAKQQGKPAGQAFFDYHTGTIYIRSRATYFQIFHETQHAIEYIAVGGEEAYIALGKVARERFVFDRIMEHQNLFTGNEIQSAKEYIKDIYMSEGGIEVDPDNLP